MQLKAAHATYANLRNSHNLTQLKQTIKAHSWKMKQLIAILKDLAQLNKTFHNYTLEKWITKSRSVIEGEDKN